MSMSMSASMPSSKGAAFFDGLRHASSPMRWFRRRLLRRPASTLAMSIGALFGGAIIMNALTLQTERHPAPIFTSLVEERPAVAPVAPVPVPPARPQTADRREPQARESRSAAAPVRDDAPRTTASTTTAKEQMLAIIRGGSPDVAEQTQKIQQVQRALNRAGYGPLKEDGVMGAGTRQALERFETDKRLPVRGEAQGRTVRELARTSGVAID